MRKWTYLVAMLMLAGATTTFTGCIDTDEPQGITELRGAKASLLKAKEAVEAAIAAEKQANAAKTLAEAKKAEAEAAYTQAQVKIKEEEAKQAALETELKAAKNEAEKARIEAEIAEAAKRKADAENQMKQAAAQFEADLKKLEALLLQNEAILVEAQKELETAKATLTDDQIAAITTAELAVTTAKTNLDEAEDEYIKANEALYEAMLGKKYSNDEARLNYNVMLYQHKLDAAKQAEALAKANSEKDVEATDWEKELEANKEYIHTQQLFIDSLDVELEKIHVENKAAWDSVEIAKNEFWDRVWSNNGFEYAFSEYTNATLDSFPAVAALLNNPTYSYQETDFGLANWYDGNQYSNGSEDLGLTAPGSWKILIDSVEGNTAAKNFIAAFDTNIKALEDAKKSLNELIKDTLDKEHQAEWDKNIAKADSTFKADSLEWTILVAAMKGDKTEPTALITEYMKAVDAYNAKFGEVANAVKAQNDAVAAVEKAESDVAVAASEAKKTELEQAYKDSIYTSELSDFDNKKVIKTILTKSDALGFEHYETFIAEGGTKTTPARLDLYLDLYAAKADSIKGVLTTKTDSLYGEWKKIKNGTNTTNYDVLIVGEANKTKDAAIAKDMGTATNPNKDSKIRKAYKEYTTAVDSIKNLESALASLLSMHGTALDNYKSKLLSEYGQVLSGADTLTHTGMVLSSDAIDCIETKLGAASTTLVEDSIHPVEDKTAELLALTGNEVELHYVGALATSTNISAAEIADLKTTELAEYSVVESQWNNKSLEAWGVNDRMLPLTEEEIAEMNITSGSLYALMQEKQAKADMNEELGMNAVIDRLIAELTAQKAVAQGELDAAIEAAEAVYADYVTRIDAYATLDDEIQAEKEAKQHLVNNYSRINNELEQVIKTYYATVIEGNTSVYNYYTYTNIDGQSKTVKSAADLKDYFFDAYLKAQKVVVYAEKAVLEAKANLERYQEGLYDAVADNNILVERAKAEYEVALMVYEAALNNLKALLSSFAAE